MVSRSENAHLPVGPAHGALREAGARIPGYGAAEEGLHSGEDEVKRYQPVGQDEQILREMLRHDRCEQREGDISECLG